MAKKLFKCWQQKFKLTLLLTFLINVSLFAQDKYTLTGVVMLETLAQPAAGVSVIVKKTDTGTVTDFDGNYTIEVKNGDVLEFVYLGFKTEAVIVAGQAVADVSLKDDTEQLEAIVVVGYGTQKQKNITSSVSKVSGKVVENAAVPRVDEALRGKIAGVNILTTATEVGADTRITVRGTGSITGTSSPLIVVDGIPLGTEPDLLSGIDSNNIESIEVLKDASSVAIYGSRGANGVVIVTLKKGKAGDTKFSYNAYTGIRFSDNNDNFNLSISEEEARIDGIIATVDTTTDLGNDLLGQYYTTKSELAAQKIIAAANGGETDWQEYVLPGGTVTSHSFSATGGNELTTFNASIGYLHDEGIYIKDDFKKYNARIRVDSRSKNKKIKYGLNINAQYIDQVRVPSRFTDALRQSSFLPQRFNEATLALVNPNDGNLYDGSTQVTFDDLSVGTIAFERAFDNYFVGDGQGGLLYNADGTPVLSTEDGNVTVASTGNNGPLGFYEERSRTREQLKTLASTYLEFNLAKGLKFKQTVSGDYRSTTSAFNQSFLSDEDRGDESVREQNIAQITHLNIESLLTYKRDYKKHSFDVLAGYSFDDYTYNEQNIGVEGVFVDAFTSNITTADTQTAPDDFTLLGSEKLVSYFGRFNYDFDDKYLLSVSARTDGSTRFGSENRYGIFPAASVGWRISGENFLSNSDVVTDLKLRASYGLSGSNDIDRDIFNSLYRSQALATSVGYGDESGRKVTNLGDSGLGWESLVEFNPGLDLELFNGLFAVSADYYDKKSEDLILNLEIPSTIGADTQLQNVGQVQNKGYELELRSRIFNNANFTWNVSGQISTNRNEVLDLGGADQQITTSTADRRPVQWITEVGGPISAFYGYVYDREVPFEQYNPFARYGLTAQEVYVKDINGDGNIDQDDRTTLGSPYPDFEWGLSSDFDIYDFDFSFSLQGSHGAERRVGDLGLFEFSDDGAATVSGNFEDFDQIIDRNLTSDHIQDASFVALRSVSLGYTVPDESIERLKLSKLRFYITGDNLIYVFADGYEGFNPEAAGQTSDGTNTPITYGYQRGDGPVTKTVTVGVNVEF